MKYAIIHISDIHFKKDAHEGARSIFRLLIDDLKKQSRRLDDYELFFSITGDIVWAGLDEGAYEFFSKEFNESLNELNLSNSRRLLVPGNHDLDRKVIDSDVDAYLKYLSEFTYDESKYNDYIDNEEYRSGLFYNYKLFESDFAKYGIGFTPQGRGWEISDKLGVYCLNSAISSCGGLNDIDDEGNLAIHTRDLVRWCNNKKTEFNVLLMHHPIEHLVKWSKVELGNIIESNFSLCLCGHNHEQGISYNRISNKCLICTAPPLFTNKDDTLGYAIICIDDLSISKIIYRQYVDGKFLNGQKFSGNDEGEVTIYSSYLTTVKVLEKKLDTALIFFRGQKNVFIRPKISKNREFDDSTNLLDSIIDNPTSSIVIAHPQFGLSCLAHYMRLEAFKRNNAWIHIDSQHQKSRNVIGNISEQLQLFNRDSSKIKCIIVDSWNGSIIDHANILKVIDSAFTDVPIIVLSTYSEFQYKSDFDISSLNHDFDILHLQAFERKKVREFISKHSQLNSLEDQDLITTKVVRELEAINIPRTPVNCLSLIKVFERDFSDSLINRTKMIQALLFILFTDSDSFTYASNKPDVRECEYILGKYCKKIIVNRKLSFTYSELKSELKTYCDEKLFIVDIDLLINILESNSILLRFNDHLQFKHSYWVYYFASTYMLQDEDFRDFILKDKNYVDYPEIIEFYTGYDSNRNDAIETLIKDLEDLVHQVSSKIGFKGKFSPFEQILWNPSKRFIGELKNEMKESVHKSNLPTEIKDQSDDKHYDSESPYNQLIAKFLKEYSVINLIQALKASSVALRNSNFVNVELRKELVKLIFQGWEEISKVLFLIAPALAHKGSAYYEGLGVSLIMELDGSFDEKLNLIIYENVYNVVLQQKSYLSSKKIGPLIYDYLHSTESIVQQHLILLFLIFERPEGWQKEVFNLMNMIHKNSFILGDASQKIKIEMKYGFISPEETASFKSMLSIVAAKHKTPSSSSKIKPKRIPPNQTINKNNKFPIDKIFAASKKPNYMTQ